MRISQLVVKVSDPKDSDFPLILVLIILFGQMMVFFFPIKVIFSAYCNNLFECHSYVFLTNNITIHYFSYLFDPFLLLIILFETDF